jgi:hypothetical protein
LQINLYNLSKPIIKGCEEDEYAPPRRYREQELMRTCPYSDAEWTSEPQGERIFPIACAGVATVI